MIRLYTDAPLAAGITVTVSGRQHHYLAHVMRQREGETIHLFNGRDGEWAAPITRMTRKDAELTPRNRTRTQDTVPDIALYFAPVKRGNIDFLSQKATELGVAALHPVITERTVVQRVNTERLHANCIEGAEQCNRLSIPAIHAPVTLAAALEDWPPERPLVWCDESGNGAPMTEIGEQLRGTMEQTLSCAILIGPEGGFTEAEQTAIRRLDAALPVSLGPRIMRADTAALAALSCIQALAGDW